MINAKRVLLTGFLLLSLLGTSGGSPAIAQDVVYVNIAAGAYGAGYHIISTAIAQVVQKQDPKIRVAVEATTGGGQANIRHLAKKDATLGFAGTDAASDGYLGIGQFKDQKMPNLRMAWVGLPLQMHIIVLSDSEVKKVSDLKGKKVATCSAGTDRVYAPMFMKAHGIARAEYRSQYQQPAEATAALRDKQIDAMICPVIGPDPSIIDLATTRELRFLPTDPVAMEALRTENPWWTKTVISKTFYRGVSEDVPTAGFYSAIVTHEGVPEKLMYQMTKAVMESQKELTAMYPAAGRVNLEAQRKFLEAGPSVPPLHPGVERYYREKGILK